MTNFLFRKAGVVFVHIHKAGGTSIRAALGKQDGSAGGYIPADWIEKYSIFAAVRHPVTRFVSTVNMFRVGRNGEDDYYSVGRIPELTPTLALDILEDSDVPFDRRVRSEVANLKHHLLPQTHPFNCLNYATDIIRYENLDADFASLCNKLNIHASLENLGMTNSSPNTIREQDLPPDVVDRIFRLYWRDFISLGYSMDLQRPATPREAEVSDPWPKLHFKLSGKSIKARDILPDPNVDLRSFMETKVQGLRGGTWAGRKRDLAEHFRCLEPEFHGKPKLCHLLACVIVALRRDPKDTGLQRMFNRIIREYGEELSKALNLRWLTSVCDTCIDVSKDQEDRAIALVGTILANTIKLAETERLLFCPNLSTPPRHRFSNGGILFDGVLSFWVSQGDMIENLISRAALVLDGKGTSAPFSAEILNRILELDTVFRRMIMMSGKDLPEMIADDARDRIDNALNGL